MEVSPPRYARSGELNIAYRVAGEGPIDLLIAPGWVSNVELMWDSTPRPFMQALAEFTRLIVFDKRGTGLSDRDVGYPTLEERMDDMRAVLGAAGSERAAVFGVSEGGGMSILFAATHHDRTHSLITLGTFAKRVWSPDYPWAPTPEERNAWIETIEKYFAYEMDIDDLAPSLANDPKAKTELAKYFRMSTSPSMAVKLAKLNTPYRRP